MNFAIGIRIYTIVGGGEEGEVQKGSENITNHT